MAPLAPTVGTVELEFTRMNRRARGNSAGKVQEQVFGVPHQVLHAAAENPQEPHVARDVQQSAVDEHGSEDGGSANDPAPGRSSMMKRFAHTEFGQAELVQEHGHIRGNDQQSDRGPRVVRLGGSKRDHLGVSRAARTPDWTRRVSARAHQSVRLWKAGDAPARAQRGAVQGCHGVGKFERFAHRHPSKTA